MDDSKRPSVLLVEDERIVAYDLQQTLLELGYRSVTVAASAEAALTAAAERCPDIVLMDIRIEGARDGIDAASLLRERFDVPIVFLTAHADDATLARATSVEPAGYLVKPVKPADLRATLEVSLHRHALARRLRERERWFATTLRSIADAVITVDLAGRVTFMNRVAEELTGIELAKAVGRPASEVMRLEGSTGTTPLQQALELGHAVTISEASLQLEDRSRRLISDSAAPVTDRGETLGAVMVFRDVTDERRLQQQLEIADRLASLGTLAAGVAHEINNPLFVVVTNTSFVEEEVTQLIADLRDEQVDAAGLVDKLLEIREMHAEMSEAARRVALIVRDLGSFARPTDSGGGRADVGRAIDWALRSTAHELRHRARTSVDVEERLFAAIDEPRLGQILVNLLVNAAHAIASGRRDENEVSILARTVADARVCIEVRDTGAGMSADMLDRVFDPFFTTKPPGRGTGLGLSICHGLVASVGGTIEAHGEVGQGSMVRITLPAASQPATPTTHAPRAHGHQRGRVLVLDDDDAVLRVLTRVLQNHDVSCTTDPSDALARLDAGERFDVILSDVMMPTMNGTEFYEELLRRHPDHAEHVVFMSGGVSDPRVAAFLDTVPNHRIAKPFETAALRQLVQELVTRVRSQTREPR